MAEESPNSWLSSLHLPGVIAVITAVAGTLLVQYEPLTSHRPPDSGSESSVTFNERAIDATMLEDPFSVISRVTLTDPAPPVTQTGDGTNDSGRPQQNAGDRSLPAPPSDMASTKLDNGKPRREVWTPEKLRDVVREALKGERVQYEGCPHEHEILVVPVLMRPFSDGVTVEMRAKQRQALLYALYSSGYTTKNRRIDCLRIRNWQTDATKDQTQGGIADVPFEWADHSEVMDPHSDLPNHITDSRYRKVLVLWLRGDMFTNQTVIGLRRLLFQILPESLPDVTVRVLGPPSTDALGQWVKDAQVNRDAAKGVRPYSHALGAQVNPIAGQWPGKLMVVSQRAAASTLDVLRSGGYTADDIKGLEERAKSEYGNVGPDDYLEFTVTGEAKKEPGDSPLFLRTMTTDGVVMDALKHELARRLPQAATLLLESKVEKKDKRGEQNHFVLLSEFDSSYGRSLPLHFLPADWKRDEAPPPWLHTFSYPRGLDGVGHQPARGKSDADGKKSAERLKDDYKPDELPTGLNQIDGLRRLATQIEEMDQRLWKEKGGHVVAVGVLGSDVFDKLLILRALRPRLKNALFFTNNLDAWFWQKDELPVTRNLIVGSAYGLALNEKFQGGVPPFRDSYQTSDFAGGLAALGVIPPKMFSNVAHSQHVRLYEIGRGGPYDLSIYSPDRKLPPTEWPESFKAARELHPPRPDEKGFWNSRHGFLSTLIFVTVGTILIVAVSMAINRRAARAQGRSRSARAGGDDVPGVQDLKGYLIVARPFRSELLLSTPAWLALWSVFLVTGTYFLWRWTHIDGEPYSWCAGISAWPAEVMRLLAVSLAVHFLIKSVINLRRLNRRLEKEFELTIPSKPRADHPAVELAVQTPVDEPMTDNLPHGANTHNQPGRLSLVLEEFLRRACWFSETKDVGVLWAEFRHRSAWRQRLVRGLAVAGVMHLLVWLVFRICDHELIPVRNAVIEPFRVPFTTLPFRAFSMASFDWWCDFVSLSAVITVTAFVTDGLWLNRSLILRMSSKDCAWPQSFVRKFVGRQLADESLVQRYIDLRFIAERSADAGRITLYPMYLVGLLVLARVQLFDNWQWPWRILAVYTGLITTVLTAALLIRRDAERLRHDALKEIRKSAEAGTAGSREAVKDLREDIIAMKEGAFAPFSAQPAVRTLIWGIGTAGLGGLWQYVSHFFNT